VSWFGLLVAGIEFDFLSRSVAASPDFGHYVSFAHAEMKEVSNNDGEVDCMRAYVTEGEWLLLLREDLCGLPELHFTILSLPQPTSRCLRQQYS
jgi:hypothetical protein